jgi:hypothetical protein
MKKVVFYTTCHGHAIAKFLRESDAFNEQYEIESVYQSPEFVRGLKGKEDAKKRELSCHGADIFIYQPVKDIYYENSTNYLKGFLTRDCVLISMPFVYNLSTWPIASVYKRDFAEVYVAEGDELALVNRDAIDELVETGFTKDQILQMFDNNKINFSFESRHRLEMNILRNREEGLDVKVADFIEENISKKRLFLFCSHPTSVVFVYMTNQILEILGCPPLTKEYPLDYYGLTYCGFPEGYPTASQGYFKFEFNTPEQEKRANLYYRSVIEGYLTYKRK